MNNLPKLFISISNIEISLITGRIDDQNNFELLEKLILQTDSINENKISNLDKITNLIKRNILVIEQKVNYTFKDIIVILDNFKISFLNLSGFKKLNGTQISKENITYILNSLKSCVEKFEENKKILHIFNSEYCLDKKKLDNLPIGLFGDFYSHELSFNMINKDDYINLKTIFDNCNIKIKKIITDSFVKGTIFSNTNPETETFFHIQLGKNNSKIFYIENNSVKFEQLFNFGIEIIKKDISKITGLDLDFINKIIENNFNINKIDENEYVEKEHFINLPYTKVKKKLISEIAKARIIEFSEVLYLKNINFKEFMDKINTIYLEINDQKHVDCFKCIYLESFAAKKKFQIKICKSPMLEELIDAAYKISQFGWKKEALPVRREKQSYISRIFRVLFS